MVMIQKTVYIDSARVAFIEKETGLKYQEWVRQITEREFQTGNQKVMQIEIPDLRCEKGHHWEYAKTRSLVCGLCGSVGHSIK